MGTGAASADAENVEENPMLIECANCHGRFTRDEVMNGMPPTPPRPLTPEGSTELFKNQTMGGKHQRCPTCGNTTLKLPQSRG